MSTYRAARSLRACWRAAWFSLVTAPSLVLFLLFMLLTFNNSVTGTFLDAARDQFKSLRLARAWSQEQLAELSGLSVRTVQRIENGDRSLYIS